MIENKRVWSFNPIREAQIELVRTDKRTQLLAALRNRGCCKLDL